MQDRKLWKVNGQTKSQHYIVLLVSSDNVISEETPELQDCNFYKQSCIYTATVTNLENEDNKCKEFVSYYQAMNANPSRYND